MMVPPATAVLGAPVEARIAVEVREGVLLVPTSALRRNPGGQTEVVVIASGKTEVRAVEVGVREGALSEVRSGLHEGDRIVGEPIGLEGGMTVRERP
jgi:macrolide-specific efflux system membrane fusion protein